MERLEFRMTKKRPKKNPITYHITTFQDIANTVTPKNINKFCREFKIALHSILLLKAINDELIKEGKIPTGSPIDFPSYEWIDD